MWLAIKRKSNYILFYQTRDNRERMIDYYLRNNIIVDTIVIRVFDTFIDCYNYCHKINEISEIINKALI